MKKKKILLTLTLCSMLLGTLGISSTIVKAEEEQTRGFFELGTNKLKDPKNADNSEPYEYWRGSYIYYGEYNGKRMMLKLLDNDSTAFGSESLLLDGELLNGMIWEDGLDEKIQESFLIASF